MSQPEKIELLCRAFSALPPNEKAMFLARVAHMATIDARRAYTPDKNHSERNYENPDGAMLRDANNFVHRVVGYMMHVLNRSEGEGQDASVIEMIEEYFRARQVDSHLWAGGSEFNWTSHLRKWLGILDGATW